MMPPTNENRGTIVNRACNIRQACELATREATAFRSAAMWNIYAVKTGSEFVTSSD